MIKLTSSQESIMVQHIQIDMHSTAYKQQGQESGNHLNTCRKKSFNKIQHSFMIKAPRKLRIEVSFLNTIKVIYDRCIANIILTGEILKAFSLK